MLESVTANCRPQPAISALLVPMLALMFAVTRGGAPANRTFKAHIQANVTAGREAGGPR
jgi:hypothetical protein